MNTAVTTIDAAGRADDRTRIAGSNQMELLLFSLGGGEVFGINVFKVREIMWTPAITPAPNLPTGVQGVISLRGSVIPVISVADFLQGDDGVSENGTLMVTEFSRRTLGFLVHEVDRIVRVAWSDVRPRTGADAATTLVTAVTELADGKLISIMDAEQIVARVFGESTVPAIEQMPGASSSTVLFADDSVVARKEIVQVLDGLGVQYLQAATGVEAWERLQMMAAAAQVEGVALSSRLSVVLTDAEMPEMDGYVLTQKIKQDARFAGIPVVMHSSLSADTNRAMGVKVGVDAYVPKFDPNVLADTLRPMLVPRLAVKH